MDGTGTTCPPGLSGGSQSHHELCERPVARQSPQPLTPQHCPGKAPISSTRAARGPVHPSSTACPVMPARNLSSPEKTPSAFIYIRSVP